MAPKLRTSFDTTWGISFLVTFLLRQRHDLSNKYNESMRAGRMLDVHHFAAHLKQIWLEPDKKSARRAATALLDDYGKRFPEAVCCLEEGLEDSLSFYDFPEVDKKRISSTNGQERLNMEIRRRSRVVGVFPSVESYLRLTICYLVEYSEDWGSERSYIREDKALGSLDRLHELMAQAAN